MSKATPDLDLDLDPTEGARRMGGFARLVTLPFRIVAGAVRAVFAVLRAAVAVVLFPIKLGYAVIRRVVLLAADLTYGLWRAVLFVIGLVVGTVRFVLHVLNATVGTAIRLAFKLVFGVVKLALKIVTFGRFGRAAAVGAAGAAITKGAKTTAEA